MFLILFKTSDYNFTLYLLLSRYSIFTVQMPFEFPALLNAMHALSVFVPLRSVPEQQENQQFRYFIKSAFDQCQIT